MHIFFNILDNFGMDYFLTNLIGMHVFNNEIIIPSLTKRAKPP